MNINTQQFAEDAVLGSILAENHLFADLQLKEEYFSGKNRMLYLAMKKLYEQRLPIDLVTLVTKGGPQDWDGASRIQQLQRLANVEKVDGHFKVIEDAYKERKKEEVLSIALRDKWSVADIQSALNDIETRNVSDRKTSKEIAMEMFNMPWEEIEEVMGMNTGIKSLNLMTSGFQDSDLVILGARPSMGKTDVMMHWAYHASKSGYIPVIFSLEMPAKKIMQRLVGMIGMVNRNKLKNPNKYLSEKEKQGWSYVMGELGDTGIEIFDNAGQTVSEIRSKVRKIANENPGKKIAIFLDYLTLIRSEEKYGTEALKVTKIVESLKGIAKEFKAPFVCLSQLSRGVEQRQDKRPMMSDLRESGGIEQAADLIAFLYRDAYYSGNKDDRSLELIIAKNREGEVGTIMCDYSTFTGVIKDANV